MEVKIVVTAIVKFPEWNLSLVQPATQFSQNYLLSSDPTAESFPPAWFSRLKKLSHAVVSLPMDVEDFLIQYDLASVSGRLRSGVAVRYENHCHELLSWTIIIHM